MMNDFKTKILVSETKGLLKTLERDVHRANFDLAFDDIDKLPERLNEFRKLIDVIEKKIMDNCTEIENEDELY